MDRLSHIAFAKALLAVTGERTDMAYLSILPLIDGEPTFLHRLHCHPLIKGPVIVNAAKIVFGSSSGVKPDMPDDNFELCRIREEYKDFVDTFNQALAITGKEDMTVDDGYGALLSVISHTYFDTYNNAVQAFAPYESYCAGQYDMWKKVDFFAYRIKWYRQTAPAVRELVLAEKFWDASFSAKQLVNGIVYRLFSLTKPSISHETITKLQSDLNIAGSEFNEDVNQFYIALEESVERHLINSVSEQ